VADGSVGVIVIVNDTVAVRVFVAVWVLVDVAVTVYGVIPGIFAVAVALSGVLVLAITEVFDGVGDALNVGVTVAVAQLLGLAHSVAVGSGSTIAFGIRFVRLYIWVMT
jgi:hypothetical protein